MSTIREVERITERLQSGKASLAEVQQFLRHSSAIVRSNALGALARYAERDLRLLDEFVAVARDPQNDARLMGTISVAHEAVAWLLRIDGDVAVEKANRLVESWPDPDRDDLIWYLSSEGLLVSEASDQRSP